MPLADALIWLPHRSRTAQNALAHDLPIVTLPGAPSQSFAGLKCSTAWKTLDWLGFVSNAREKTAFYIDNIEVENQTE